MILYELPEIKLLNYDDTDIITSSSSEEGMFNGGEGSGGTVDFGQLFPKE